MPSLSVIIPIYNGARNIPALKEMFERLQQQPEIIFVDDGSTDNSSQQIKKYFPSAHYIYQKNAGVATARNIGAKQAAEDYLLFLDCDDRFDPTLLWERVTLAEIEKLDVLTSPWRMEIHKNGKIDLEAIRKMDAPDDVFDALMAGNWWGPPHAYIIKQSAYWDINGADESLVNAQDFDVWIRLAIAEKKWGSCRLLAGHYLRDLNQTSLARGPRKQYWSDTEIVINKAAALLDAQQGLTNHKRLITAQRLHFVARNVYSINHAWYQKILKRIDEIAPHFKPEGSHIYRWTAHILGLEKAEKIAQFKQKLTGRFAR